ncbi:MAG: TonB family protein [Paracoccaceae bacterium]
MTDWAAHLGRTRRMMESLAWLGSAALIFLLATAAWAMWPAGGAGAGAGQTVIVELPPLPVEAVPEDPGPAPEAQSFSPDAPDAPDLNDDPPQAETTTEEAPQFEQPDLLPPEDVAEQMPDTTPPPPVAQKAAVELPQKMQKKEAPKKKAKKAEKTDEAQGKKSELREQVSAGKVSNAGSNAMVTAEARWKSKANSIVARHMKKRTFTGNNGVVVLAINITAAGAIVSVSMSGSTGNAALDAKILNHAQRIPQLPPTPSGQGRPLSVRIVVD